MAFLKEALKNCTEDDLYALRAAYQADPAMYAGFFVASVEREIHLRQSRDSWAAWARNNGVHTKDVQDFVRFVEDSTYSELAEALEVWRRTVAPVASD